MIVTAVRCYPPCDMKLFSLLIAFGFLSCVAQADPIAFCPFCNGERIRGWTSAAHSDFLKSTYNPFPDAPVMSTKHFVAYITKGAFTPHYFLLVSKEHFERIADLFRNGSLSATVLGNVNGLQVPRERLDLD